jgi:hypothetical protein
LIHERRKERLKWWALHRHQGGVHFCSVMSRACKPACSRFERPEKATRRFTAGASARVRRESHSQPERDTNQRCCRAEIGLLIHRKLRPHKRFRCSLEELSLLEKRALLRRGFLSGSFHFFRGLNAPHELPENAGRETFRRFAFSAFPTRICIDRRTGAALSSSGSVKMPCGAWRH